MQIEDPSLENTSQQFNFEVKHCSGKDNPAADCLSRVNFLDDEPGELLVNEQEIAESQKFDEETKSMIVCLNDECVLKPDNVHNNLWRHRNDFCVRNGILETKFSKIFVPFKFRLKVLTVAHGLHHGIQQTLGRLRSKLF